MRDNLRVYSTLLSRIRQMLPGERITRVRNLAFLMTGLHLSASIHLPKIASRGPMEGQIPSLVNRLRRFLDNPRVKVDEYYRQVASRLLQAVSAARARLVIDCTPLGSNHQLMMVALAYRRRTLPLGWQVMEGKKGVSSARTQIRLLQRIAGCIPPDTEVIVIGDGEFHAVKLMRWIRLQGWHLRLRLPSDTYIWLKEEGWVKLANLPIQPGQRQYYPWIRVTKEHNYGWLHLAITWDEGEDEPWYIITDQPADYRTLRDYAVRMWVDETFGDMKGHGFDLEATHLRHTDRLMRLVLAVCLVYVWLIALGSYVIKRGWRKRVDRKDRRDLSIFQIGWRWLQRQLATAKSLYFTFLPYF